MECPTFPSLYFEKQNKKIIFHIMDLENKRWNYQNLETNEQILQKQNRTKQQQQQNLLLEKENTQNETVPCITCLAWFGIL